MVINQTNHNTQDNNSKTTDNFETPSSWGSSNSQSSPAPEPVDVNVTLPDIKKEPQTSNSLGFIKIFLISVALILLGALFGVLAANFITPKTITEFPDNSMMEPVSSDYTMESNQIDEVVSDKSQIFEYRNIGQGPFSFDLKYDSSWMVATESADKTNPHLTLEKDNLIFDLSYNPKTAEKMTSLCLKSEEITPKGIPYVRYDMSQDVSIGDTVWRFVKDSTATESAIYRVCEQNSENQFLTMTMAGFIESYTKDGNEITKQEESSILTLLSGFEFISTSTNSAIQNNQ